MFIINQLCRNKINYVKNNLNIKVHNWVNFFLYLRFGIEPNWKGSDLHLGGICGNKSMIRIDFGHILDARYHSVSFYIIP